MLWAILNKSWRQHPTKHQLYGHLPPIMKTIQVRRTRHAGHCWRSRDELISDVLLWTPTYGRAKAGQPAQTYIQQLCEDMGCSPEDLPEAMNNRENWCKRVRDIHASRTSWWWWWWCCPNRPKRKQNKEQVLRTCQRTKKAMDYKGDGYSSCNWYPWNNAQRLGKRAGGAWNQRMSRDHTNYRIVEVS